MNHASFDNWTATSAVNPPPFGDTLLFPPISAGLSHLCVLAADADRRAYRDSLDLQLYPSIPIQSISIQSSSSSDVSDLSSSTQPSECPSSLSCQPLPPVSLIIPLSFFFFLPPFSCQIPISFIIQLLFHTKKTN